MESENNSQSTHKKIISFKIDPNETWVCEKHSQSKIFYCLDHSMPFCPSCLKEKHKDCFNKDMVFDAQNITVSLENRCKELQQVAQNDIEGISKLKENYENVSTLAIANKEKHEKLYELIKNHVIELTKIASEKKSKEDLGLLENGKSILKNIDDTLTEYASLITGYDNVLKNINSEEHKGVKELILAYESLKIPESGSAYKKHTSISNNISSFHDSVLKTEIKYSESAVKETLEKAFKKIHSEGAVEKNEQVTHDFGFSLAPLSSLLCVYDLDLKNVKRMELSLGNGKPYKMPYGAASAKVLGKIFITGGSSDLVKTLSNNYEYSMLKEFLIERSSMNFSRMEHGIVSINNEIFCAGGRCTEKGYLSSCESFDTNLLSIDANRKWKIRPNLNEAKSFITLCAFTNQKSEQFIYAFNGLVNEKIVSKIERLALNKENEDWQIFSASGHMDLHSMGCIQITLNSEMSGILLIGGLKEGNQKAKEAYFFDPKGNDGKFVMKRWEDIDTSKEEEYYYRPLIRQKGTNLIYAVCQSQLLLLNQNGKEKWGWKEIICSNSNKY